MIRRNFVQASIATVAGMFATKSIAKDAISDIKVGDRFRCKNSFYVSSSVMIKEGDIIQCCAASGVFHYMKILTQQDRKFVITDPFSEYHNFCLFVERI